MQTHKPIQWTNSYKYLGETNSEINSKIVHDEIYTESNDINNINIHSMSLKKFGSFKKKVKRFDKKIEVKNRVKRHEADPRCDSFLYAKTKGYITHPHDEKETEGLYYNNSDCTTVITGKFMLSLFISLCIYVVEKLKVWFR